MNIDEPSLTVMYSKSDFQFLYLPLRSPSERLYAITDSELVINIKLFINFNLYVIVLLFSFSFLIGTKNMMYFSVFSPRHSNCFSNYLANS